MTAISGVGLGLRRPHIVDLQSYVPAELSFLELAPENWIGVGGRRAMQLAALTEQVPIVCHGLSLSIGGMKPLDVSLINRLKQFFKQHAIAVYSEHLSYSNDEGNLYDLFPIPFSEEAVYYVASRIKEVQARLERRIALENISYYCVPQQELSELEFIKAVVCEADCELLLDVNNVYVNSINHQYDPIEFLQGLAELKVSYMHIAGHEQASPTLLIDSHGTAVCHPVWCLLQTAYDIWGVKPTVLERDFNIPPLSQLIPEIKNIKQYQQAYAYAYTA